MSHSVVSPSSQHDLPASWPLWVTVGYVVIVVWGTTWYGIHTQVNGTAPHIGVALRMGAASAICIAIAIATRRSLRLTSTQAMLVLVEGICFFGLNYLAVYAGSQYLTSGVVAVILSLTVPLTLFADRLIRGITPTPKLMLAAALGMCGVCLVFGSELDAVFADRARWWGAGIVASSALLVAIGNVVAARLMDSRMSWITINALGMAVGAISALVWGGVSGVSGAAWTVQITPTWLMGFAYLVLFGSALAFGIYMKILPTIGTTAGAYVTVLSPMLALIVSAWLEDYYVGPLTYLGVVLLLVGHGFLIRQPSRRIRT